MVTEIRTVLACVWGWGGGTGWGVEGNFQERRKTPCILFGVVVTLVYTIVKTTEQKIYGLCNLVYLNYTLVKHNYVMKRERLKTPREKSHFLVHTSYPCPQFLQNEQSEFTLCALSGQGPGGNCFRCFLKCDAQRGPFAGQGENPRKVLTGEGICPWGHIHSVSWLPLSPAGQPGDTVFTLSFFSTNILETVAMCQALANAHWSLTLPKRGW